MVDRAGDLPGRNKFSPCSEGGVLPPSRRLRGARGLEGYSAGAKAGSFLPKLGVAVRRMSDGELSRIEVLRDVDRKRLTSASVAQLLRL